MTRISLFSVGLLMLASCTDGLPSAVQPEQLESVQAKAAATPAELAYAIDGIDDARKRIILPLADRDAARALEEALAAFQTALGSADARGIPALIEVARAAVEDPGARQSHVAKGNDMMTHGCGALANVRHGAELRMGPAQSGHERPKARRVIRGSADRVRRPSRPNRRRSPSFYG